MTRFVVDPGAVIRLLHEDPTLPAEHRLVAPAVLRSQVLSSLYRERREGRIDAERARTLLERFASLRIRLLSDRVSRNVAWRIAEEHGWDDTLLAEYLAVTRLQADALISLDAELASRADGVVETAPYEALLSAS